MKTGCKVYDAMTKRPVTVKPDSTVKMAAQTMKKEKVGSLLVIDGDRCLGIVTEYDIVRKAVADGMDPETKVTEIMSKDLISVHPEDDISDAATVMGNKNVRHIPVMDGKKFMGFLTAKDVLKVQPELFDLLVEKYELREEEDKPVKAFYQSDGVCELCGEYATKIYEVDGSHVCVKCKHEMNDEED